MKNLSIIRVMLLSFFLTTVSGYSQSSKKISIQGILKDGDGAAVPDGDYSLTFSLYDALSGGNLKWTETQAAVRVRGGVYSALLGTVKDFNSQGNTAIFDVPYFLGVKVNGGDELTPRTELSYAPYALAVNNAATSTLAAKASSLASGGGNGSAMSFHWSGQGGQPTWLWGGNDGTNHYVWNPSNFNVNYANTAGSAPANGGNATTVSGLYIHGGRNNEANKIVRTNSSGYLDVGYINSNSGNEGNNSSPARVWGTNGSDDYMRSYLTSALVAGSANALNGSNNYYVNAIRATGSHGDQTGQGGASWRYLYGFNGNHGNLGNGLGVIADNIGASSFFAFSDKRIKKDIRSTNPISDAKLLEQFEVVDYRYQDSIEKGNEFVKGFIAQQVQSILPEAVTTMTDVVPDIYTLSTSVVHSKNESLISMSKDHLLNAGDRVKVIWDKGQKIVDVIKCPTSRQFVVNGLSSEANSVFVYGKEVNDFLTVNYDRIYTMGISVTQQLIKKVSVLEKENESLRRENTEMKEMMMSLASRLSLLEQSSVSKVTKSTVLSSDQ